MTIIPSKSDKTSEIKFDQERLLAANINPVSYLATDYLNHFNEIIMLIEIIADMPDMIDDVLNWLPVSYEQHFEQSGFMEKDLAIAAYAYSPPILREKFDEIVADINQNIVKIQAIIRSALPELSPQLYEELNLFVAEKLRPKMDKANAIIHGEGETLGVPSKREPGTVQKAIDELFSCPKSDSED